VAIERALLNHNNHREGQHKRHSGLSRGSAKYNTCLPPRCGVPMDEGYTQPLSSDPMINLNTTVFFLIVFFPFVRNLHKLDPLALTRLISKKAWSKVGICGIVVSSKALMAETYKVYVLLAKYPIVIE
jgi:hypothetical protein